MKNSIIHEKGGGSLLQSSQNLHRPGKSAAALLLYIEGKLL
jgi:hypothetical protein